jgi:hypothetical protein
MSVDIKGVVVTSLKNPFFVAERITDALNLWIRTNRKNAGIGPFTVDKNNSVCEVLMHTTSEMVSIIFTLNGENRKLTIHFDCDSDHKDLGPQSLVLSLGCWGLGVPIMKMALHSLSALGPCYLDENDSDDVDLALIVFGSTMTYTKAVVSEMVNLSMFSLEKWCKLCSSENDYPRIVGWTKAQVDELFRHPVGEKQQRLEALYLRTLESTSLTRFAHD